ncbi:hypothetical protein [Sulfitobacter donghicola]|uniref:hypothetical protein n=1 Tax=Sulfitobacter donghicola TaxID=421000 RepID=UPI0012DC4C60|nr:hypothetical protein [Sulfitobacter donghicola]
MIWAAKRLLTGEQVSQSKERKFAEFKARCARLDAVHARASAAWEAYFNAGGMDNADPIARSYHAFVREMMEELYNGSRHPEYDRAIQALHPLQEKVSSLRVAAGLPEREPQDTSSEPQASPELAAARKVLAKAKAEATRASRLVKPDVTTKDLKSPTYLTKCLYGWAAHVLPEAEFEDFFLDIWERHPPSSSQVKDAQLAFNKARVLRDFPRLAGALDRWPDLPFSYTKPTDEQLLHAQWKNAEPIVRDSDPIEKIEAAFAGFSADDLHEVSHGQDIYSAPFMLAIARHPLCDWASALEILHSFCASGYQDYWIDRKPEADFGKHDRMMFEAFEIISQRANGIGFRSRSFQTNYHFGPLTAQGKLDPNHPQNWLKWAIPEHKLIRPKGASHKPSILLDGAQLRPTFEAWRAKPH